MKTIALLAGVAVLGMAGSVGLADRVIQLSGVQGQYTITIPDNQPAVPAEAPNALRGDAQKTDTAAPQTNNNVQNAAPAAPAAPAPAPAPEATPRQGTNSN